MNTNDGGPVYPTSGRNYGYVEDGRDGLPADSGMSLRDYFAAAALQGLVSREPPADSGQRKTMYRRQLLELSEASYQLADAMLAERERTPDAWEDLK